MLEVTPIKADAEKRYHELSMLKNSLESWLADCPAGKIHVTKSRNRIQYYLRKDPKDKTGVYLSKDKQKEIHRYMQKAYYEKVSRLIKAELHALERFLDSYQDLPTQIRNVYSDMPDPMKHYVRPIDTSDQDYMESWSNIPFVPKEMLDYEGHFITDRGEHVRSKSELHIANTLNKMNIPYKYERPLEIRKGVVVHPDFTVLNKKSREVYYWEHRGMMDDREYAKHSVVRLKEYGRCGIFPGKGLIITEETSVFPLGSKEILDVIQTYLFS